MTVKDIDAEIQKRLQEHKREILETQADESKMKAKYNAVNDFLKAVD
jgi:hypothetical protein